MHQASTRHHTFSASCICADIIWHITNNMSLRLHDTSCPSQRTLTAYLTASMQHQALNDQEAASCLLIHLAPEGNMELVSQHKSQCDAPDLLQGDATAVDALSKADLMIKVLTRLGLMAGAGFCAASQAPHEVPSIHAKWNHPGAQLQHTAELHHEQDILLYLCTTLNDIQEH